MNERNLKAFKFHRTCKAINSFPDDSIVRRNAELIESVKERIENNKSDQLIELLSIVLSGGVLRG